jgi:hypothetical protein
MGPMSVPVQFGAMCAAVYLLAWAASYRYFGGLDFDETFEYLMQSWTIDGVELPRPIWFYGTIALLPVAAVSVALMKRRDRNENAG